MKLTIKLFLIISLFCSIALADGDQSTGNKNGGGLTCIECVNENGLEDKKTDDEKNKEGTDTFLNFIQNFFGKLLG